MYFRPIATGPGIPKAKDMFRTLRALWNEPRSPHPPVRGRGDWLLVGALLVWSVVEVVLRDDPAWRPLVLLVSVVIAASLLWRRSHPLSAVAVAFGTILAFDVARIVAIENATGLTSVAALLLLPYSLFRWGSGREAGIGLGLVGVWLIVTHIADYGRPVNPFSEGPTGAGEVVAGVGFFLFSAALGASVRFHSNSRSRDIEQAKLRERNLLARELHDAVGHHVSAIAIQAQAGRMSAESNPTVALKTFGAIEQAASRALTEMRAMVGVLRDGTDADLAPQPRVADIERLAGHVEGQPMVDVSLSGDLDRLTPAVEVALYRIAQEAITNASRHARHATKVIVDVVRKDERVCLTVRDNGDMASLVKEPRGYGLVGMAERASLLGGTLHAGPDEATGWIVEASFPAGGKSP